jgi:hypothetical protein
MDRQDSNTDAMFNMFEFDGIYCNSQAIQRTRGKAQLATDLFTLKETKKVDLMKMSACLGN